MGIYRRVQQPRVQVPGCRKFDYGGGGKAPAGRVIECMWNGSELFESYGEPEG